MEYPDADIRADLAADMPPGLLPDGLWERAEQARDRRLTPLYIGRYAGPRSANSAMTGHCFWELTYSLDGQGCLQTAAGDVEAGPGQALIIPPGLVHREVAVRPGWDVIWIGLAGEIPSSWPVADAVQRIDCPALVPWVEQLWQWSRRQPGAIGPELDQLCQFLIAAIRRQAARGDDPAGGWLERVLTYIHDHMADELQVADMARVADCSVGHFQRRFRAEVGETPIAYLTRLRLETALAYLRQSSHSIAHIAATVGYRDPLYFTKVCRRHFGRPPSDLR